MTEEAGSPQHGSGDGGEALLPPAAHSLPLAVPDGDGAAAACVPAAADPGEQPPNGEGGGAEAQKGDRGGGGGSSDETQLDEASAAAADEMDGHGTRTQSRPAKRGRSSLARGSAAGRGRRPKALDDHIDAGSDAQQAANGRGRRSTAAVESPSRSQQTARRRRAPSSSAQPRDLDGEPEEDKMDCDDPEAATDHKATPSKRKRGPRSRPAPARERNPARKRRSVGSGDGPHEADPAGQIPDSLGGASGEEAGTMKSPKRGNAPGSSRRNNLPAALRPETLFKSASSLLVVHKEEASQLLSKAVWDTFTPDEQRELLALLPSVDTVSQANPDAPRAIRDGLLRKDYHLCDSFNRMIEDLAEGLYTDREQRLMLQNFEKTVHKFDEWKARNYEAVWGDQLDISRWRRLAGAASEISFAELCLNARVFVGDTLHIKKTFKKLGMSLDLFAEITHISKQGVATLRCGQTTWTSDTLTQIENKFIDIGIPNLPKSERPNGNAWKSITLLRSGKKVGSMFDVRADYSSGTRQGASP